MSDSRRIAYTSGCEEPRKKVELITQSLADEAKGREEKIYKIMAVPTFQTKPITCKSTFLIKKSRFC